MLATELCWSSLKNPRNWSWRALTCCICVGVCVQCAVCSSSSSSSNFTNFSTLCGFFTHQVHHQIKVAPLQATSFSNIYFFIIIKFLLQLNHQVHDQILYYLPMFFQIHHTKFFYLPMFFKNSSSKILYYPMFFKFIIKNSLFTNVFQIHH